MAPMELSPTWSQILQATHVKDMQASHQQVQNPQAMIATTTIFVTGKNTFSTPVQALNRKP